MYLRYLKLQLYSKWSVKELSFGIRTYLVLDFGFLISVSYSLLLSSYRRVQK